MTKDRMDRLMEVVHNAPPNALRSKVGRKALGKRLVHDVGLWEPEVQSFLDEMVGLNFYNLEDRQLFIQFAECAF